MSELYPNGIVLKQHKCPSCGEKIGAPLLRRNENAVQAACRNQQCDFSLDLFFIGDAAHASPGTN